MLFYNEEGDNMIILPGRGRFGCWAIAGMGLGGSFRIILERFLPHLFLNEDKELAFTIPVGGGIIIGIAAGLIYEYITTIHNLSPSKI